MELLFYGSNYEQMEVFFVQMKAKCLHSIKDPCNWWNCVKGTQWDWYIFWGHKYSC